MSKQQIQDIFDNQGYEEVIELTNPYLKAMIEEDTLLYYLTSILALDDFKIADIKEVKKILFLYFYLHGSVDFGDYHNISYSIKINTDLLKFSLEEEDKIYNIGKEEYKKYFDFGDNAIFFQGGKGSNRLRKNMETSDNIIDTFLFFVYECSELYSFHGENFALFKWLINELCEE